MITIHFYCPVDLDDGALSMSFLKGHNLLSVYTKDEANRVVSVLLSHGARIVSLADLNEGLNDEHDHPLQIEDSTGTQS